jgi:hypothetical protein
MIAASSHLPLRQRRPAPIAKAQADARVLAPAVSIYSDHMGNVSPTLGALTAVASNGQGQTAGPFMATIPSPSAGWTTPYAYAPNTSAARSRSPRQVTVRLSRCRNGLNRLRPRRARSSRGARQPRAVGTFSRVLSLSNDSAASMGSNGQPRALAERRVTSAP